MSQDLSNAREMYLSQVRYAAEQRRQQRETLEREAAQRLTVAIRAWYSSLDQNDRPTRVTMAQLMSTFRAPANALGLALYNLGWRRKRDYRLDRPHSRYWRPPDVAP